jgi:hypothetical protein
MRITSEDRTIIVDGRVGALGDGGGLRKRYKACQAAARHAVDVRTTSLAMTVAVQSKYIIIARAQVIGIRRVASCGIAASHPLLLPGTPYLRL